MTKRVLLQHATNEYLALIQLTRYFHANYAAYHQMEYRLNTKRRALNNPIWDKIVDINEWLSSAKDGDEAVFLDADTFWKDPHFCLCNALPVGSELGMVMMNIGYFNAGVLFLRASKQLRKFFEAVALGNTPQRTRFPSGHPFNGTGWEDQAYINWELGNFSELKVIELDSRFNWFNLSAKPPSGEVVIQAWHAQAFSCVYKGIVKAVTGAPLFALSSE